MKKTTIALIFDIVILLLMFNVCYWASNHGNPILVISMVLALCIISFLAHKKIFAHTQENDAPETQKNDATNFMKKLVTIAIVVGAIVGVILVFFN